MSPLRHTGPIRLHEVGVDAPRAHGCDGSRRDEPAVRSLTNRAADLASGSAERLFPEEGSGGTHLGQIDVEPVVGTAARSRTGKDITVVRCLLDRKADVAARTAEGVIP